MRHTSSSSPWNTKVPNCTLVNTVQEAGTAVSGKAQVKQLEIFRIPGQKSLHLASCSIKCPIDSICFLPVTFPEMWHLLSVAVTHCLRDSASKCTCWRQGGMRALSCPVHMGSDKARGQILRLLDYPPQSPPVVPPLSPTQHLLLLNLLPHSFSSFILWNTLLTFPAIHWVLIWERKALFAPVMGTLSLLNKEEDVYHTGGYCLETLLPRNSFLDVLMLTLCPQGGSGAWVTTASSLSLNLCFPSQFSTPRSPCIRNSYTWKYCRC